MHTRRRAERACKTEKTRLVNTQEGLDDEDRDGDSEEERPDAEAVFCHIQRNQHLCVCACVRACVRA